MNTQKKVRKAIIPAAGYGTRFLPATKASPKEMLPVVDKPIIQYVVEDAVSAGIEDIIIVTGWSKRSIEDHFDYPFELERRLEESGKFEALEEIRRIANLANFHFIRQKGPLGNATPILNARRFVGDEPFVVLWGDEFMKATPTRCQQLIAAFETDPAIATLSCIRTKKEEDYKRYAFAAGNEVEGGKIEIKQILEKPGMGAINSDFAVVGGAVYTPEMFDAIEEAKKRLEFDNTPRELVYVDAINVLLEQKKRIVGLEIKNSKFYDTGNKLEYLKAVVEFGLEHEDLKAEFSDYLKNLKV